MTLYVSIVKALMLLWCIITELSLWSSSLNQVHFCLYCYKAI